MTDERTDICNCRVAFVTENDFAQHFHMAPLSYTFSILRSLLIGHVLKTISLFDLYKVSDNPRRESLRRGWELLGKFYKIV